MDGQISIATVLKQAGYHTSMFGKWFVAVLFRRGLQNGKFLSLFSIKIAHTIMSADTKISYKM